MYLPTFWKLTTEATMYRLRHVSGYVVPIGTLGKSVPSPSSQTPHSLSITDLYSDRHMGFVPLSLQLLLFLHPPSPQR